MQLDGCEISEWPWVKIETLTSEKRVEFSKYAIWEEKDILNWEFDRTVLLEYTTHKLQPTKHTTHTTHTAQQTQTGQGEAGQDVLSMKSEFQILHYHHSCEYQFSWNFLKFSVTNSDEKHGKSKFPIAQFSIKLHV